MKILSDSDKNIRTAVLETSLYLEKRSSYYLRLLLGIDINSESKAFGNTSEALSLMNKINLLLDIKYIRAEIKKELKLFSEIRNQIVHNLDADTCTKIIDLVKQGNPISTLKQQYLLNQKYNNEEEENKDFLLKLCNRVHTILENLMEPIDLRLVYDDLNKHDAEIGGAYSIVHLTLATQNKTESTNAKEVDLMVQKQIERVREMHKELFSDKEN